MSIPLFDVQTGFGGASPGTAEVVSVADLLAEMARLDIGRALVRITPEELENDVPDANARLFAACTDQPGLLPCPIAVPSGTNTESKNPLVDEFIRQDAGAVWLRPAQDYWSLAPWACDHLFTALQARRLPVLCLERLVSLEQVAALAERYPGLPFILAEVSYRQQRTLLPLLRTFSNIWLSLGKPYSVFDGIEQLVAEVGSGRLLFGTGFPAAEPMAAISMLMYAGITDEDRRLIGAGNLQRLLEGVVR